MPSNTTTFQNENIEGTIAQKPGCLHCFHVHMFPKMVKSAYQKAIKNVSKEVSIPGFRKGKAPEATILKLFGSQVDKEWRSETLYKTVSEVILLTGQQPYGEHIKKAEIEQISLEDGAKIAIEYEVYPSVPSISPKEFTIPVFQRKEISEADINQTIENLRMRNAEWEKVPDRAVQEGDYVIGDVMETGKTPKTLCIKERLYAKTDMMSEWLLKIIIGMQPGETKEGVRPGEHGDDCNACNEGHEHTHHHGATSTPITVVIHAIEAPKLPEINDDLARAFGAKDLNDLKQKIEFALNRNADEETKSQAHQACKEVLLNTISFDIPNSMIQREYKRRTEDLTGQMRSDGLKESQIQKMLTDNKAQILMNVESDLRLQFLINRVLREQQITVAQNEVDAALTEYLIGQNRLGDTDFLKNIKQLRENWESILLNKKFFDWFLEGTIKKLDHQDSSRL